MKTFAAITVSLIGLGALTAAPVTARECSATLEAPIAVPTSKGDTLLLWPNTAKGNCTTGNAIGDAFWARFQGHDARGASRETSGGTEGSDTPSS